MNKQGCAFFTLDKESKAQSRLYWLSGQAYSPFSLSWDNFLRSGAKFCLLLMLSIHPKGNMGCMHVWHSMYKLHLSSWIRCKFPCCFHKYVYNLNPYDYKKKLVLSPFRKGEFRLALLPPLVTSQINFPSYIPNVSVIGFAAHRADGLGFGSSPTGSTWKVSCSLKYHYDASVTSCPNKQDRQFSQLTILPFPPVQTTAISSLKCYQHLWTGPLTYLTTSHSFHVSQCCQSHVDSTQWPKVFQVGYLSVTSQCLHDNAYGSLSWLADL